jgi:hypothetical protein
MVLDVSVAMTWILFLALFPIAFFWLRRAWRIVVRRDFSEVALKRGEPPVNAEKYAPYTAVINLICGVVAVWVIFGVLFLGLAFDTWSATAGITIWGKFFADFILSRHAHPISLGKKS